MQNTSAYLRQVTEKDMDLLYEWANDVTVRANAFSTEQISYADHERWFASKLQDEDTKIYIYVCEEKPVGQIRIHMEGDEATIDYSIDARYRRQGHGKQMLKQLEQIVQEQYPQIKSLLAQVKRENKASKSVFAAGGYEEEYIAYRKKLR